MKKLLLALIGMSVLGLTSAFAGESTECKKCSGADKNAACTCKACDKDKESCPKDGKDAKPAPSTEKKS